MVERYMDNGRCISRDELELVVQKNKVKEIHEWFEKHFYDPDHLSYSKRCPYVIIQGPTGCGKTTTLKWIARDLKLSIKEFSETTDTTSINIELKNLPRDETNFPLSNAKRNALKFERYVVDSVRYNTLYPVNNAMIESDDDADSEFDSDDETFFLPPDPPTPIAGLGHTTTTSNPISSSVYIPKTYPKAQSEPLPKPRRPAPPTDGIIIHVETPLSFGKFQKILTQCLHNLMRILAEISRRQPRRIAIVFETLEGDGEIISLPTKVKQLMGIKVFKFNQITQANMRNLINNVMTGYSHIIMEKETLNQLVNDCDGDARACLNTLQLICTHLDKQQHVGGFNRNELQSSKKLKTHHPELRAKRLTFTPGLARDISRNSTLFHTLGKIFYQKREYPLNDANSRNGGNGWKARAQLNQPPSRINASKYRGIDRPYPLQNSTDYLVSRVDMEAKNLTSWLHQHYARFCRSDNISKAADFLDHLSTVDTVSLDSTQSNQFYESKPLIDQLQKYIAIEATVFSLYTDVSEIQQNPRSVKKAVNKDGFNVSIRSSVETNQEKDGSDLYGFTRPISLVIPKLSKGYRSLIDLGSSRMMLISERPIEQSKFLLEYSPYMNALLANYKSVLNSRSIASPEGSRYHGTIQDWSNLKPFSLDRDLCEIIDELQLKLSDSRFSDEQKHEELYERLVEMIDRCEIERFERDDEDSDMMSQ